MVATPAQERFAPARLRVISCDSHVMEAGDVWISRLPESDRDRCPRVVRDGSGYHFYVDGQLRDIPGFNSELVEGRPGIANAELRVMDQVSDGIDAEFLYPSRTMGLQNHPDREFLGRCYEAYNRWLAEFTGQYPDRLYGVALLRFDRPNMARGDIGMIKDLGFKAMALPSWPRDVYYNSRSFEPLWEAAAESGIPLSFHVGENFNWKGYGSLGANITQSLQPFRNLWPLFAFSGILERHPGLRMVFVEGGISWVPSCLYDADLVYERFATAPIEPKLENPPSFYFKRQCWATFQDDPYGLRLLDVIGADRVLWASDYPHPESTFGHSRQIVRDIFDQVGEEAGRMIMGGNAASLYGI